VLELSYSFTEMKLQSVGLRIPPPSFQLPTSNPIQLNALLSTLEAGKRFLDTLLAYPVSDYHLLSFSEWMRLPYVAMIIFRLTIPSEAHMAAQWDVKAAQDRVRLDLYLESLCYRMQSLSTYDKAKQRHPDFWYAMRMIMDLTRSWYRQKIQAANAQSSQSSPGDLMTPDTAQTSSNGNGGSNHALQMPSINEMGDFSCPGMGMMPMADLAGFPTANPDDPLAFMRNVNFDMDQFLDMGIWGSESYDGMGFGRGGMGF